MGLLALLGLLDRDARADDPADPLAAKPPPLQATAKSVIWCFLDGGPSHIDLFDPKPELTKLDGTAAAAVVQAARDGDGPHLLHAAARIQTHASSNTAIPACGSATGIPKSRSCADDLAVLRRAATPTASTTSAASAR